MGNDIEFVPCKTLITNNKNKFWFGTDYNMNIYRGCSHGCIYCDSRSECYRDDSFYKVKVKKDALSVLVTDLKSKKQKGVIGTGSMSDPYNPLEEELQLSREALKLMDKHGFGVAIATKSPLLVRDVDILSSISKHAPVLVKMTITTADDQLSSLIEPNISPSSQRFAALKTLATNNIFCGVLLMPVLPFITDTVENIEAIVEKAAQSQVNFVYPAFGLTLRDRQRTYYYDKLDELFPGLKSLYRKTYGSQYSCVSKNAKLLQQHLVMACERYNILYKMDDIIAAYQKSYATEQLSLF